jgi:predicted transcriptional regulator
MEEVKEAGYNITRSVRLDAEMVERLEKIAVYEKSKPATLMRMWLQQKIMAYYHNPRFKQWLKQLGRIPLKKE